MENFNEKAIIERVKQLRNQYAGSRGKSKFARALSLTPSTYNPYEEDRVPAVETVLKICAVTGADLNWLLTGEKGGKKSISGPNSAVLQKLDGVFTSNPEIIEAVLAFTELLCEKKQIEQKSERSRSPVNISAIKPSSARLNQPDWIPVLGRTAAGMIHFWDQSSAPSSQQAVTELDELVKEHVGKNIMSSAEVTLSVDLQTPSLVDGLKSSEVNFVQVSGQQDKIVEFVECRQIRKLFPDSFALRIDGDSMSPRINDGDIVILSPSVPAAQGQIGIARIANQIGVTCKLIRSTETAVHLIPINERYETKVVPKDDLLWTLTVLCHIRL